MAYITKRGSSYSVRYTYQDEHGKSCDKWESFPTKEEAVKRQKQIEHELATGNFLIPSTVTVAEFLMDWLPKQCSKHKWAPKTYESNLSAIQNLIIPYGLKNSSRTSRAPQRSTTTAGNCSGSRMVCPLRRSCSPSGIGSGAQRTRSLSRSCSMVCGIPVPPTSSCSRTVTSNRCRATQVMQRHLS